MSPHFGMIFNMKNCFIWGIEAQSVEREGDGFLVESARAGGKYRITGSAASSLNGSQDFSRSAALSEHVFLSNRSGIVPLIDTSLLTSIVRPKVLSPLDKFHRFMGALAILIPDFGKYLLEDACVSEAGGMFLAAAINSEERNFYGYKDSLRFLFAAAERKSYIRRLGTHRALELTLEGWALLHQLGQSLSHSNQIFVAMWFGGERQSDLYNLAIGPAIAESGYTPVRIDNTEHNEKIDDQIISEIRKSRAVIVDLTCGLASPIGSWSTAKSVGSPRGGVFFEAGFAKGLGLPVIWTVNSDVADVENVVHFDVRQYNQIRWGADLVEFKERLRFRIEASVGRGSI